MELELSQMLILFACVFLGGLVDSIAGGGGLITLPAYYAVGIPAHMALGTNKFANSIGTLTALLRFLKEGQIQHQGRTGGGVGRAGGLSSGRAACHGAG